MPEKKLRFPLHNDDEYKAKIVFTLVKEKDVSGDTLAGTLGSITTSAIKFAGEAADLFGLSKDDVQKQVNEHDGASNKSATKARRRINDTKVSLYLPTALTFRDNVAYENFDLGTAGALIEGGKGLAASAAEGVGSIANLFQGNSQGPVGGIAKLAAVKLAGLKPGFFQEERQRVAQGSLRVTTNPNTRVFFKQVNIRDFAFTFKLIARSQKEAQEVKDIVKFFRTELYPSEILVDDISVGYNFPDKFKIQFLYDNKAIAHKLKDCYLRDVSTVYNQSGMSMHSDGEFLEVDLTLTFQETRALTRKDVEEGGY